MTVSHPWSIRLRISVVVNSSSSIDGCMGVFSTATGSRPAALMASNGEHHID